MIIKGLSLTGFQKAVDSDLPDGAILTLVESLINNKSSDLKAAVEYLNSSQRPDLAKKVSQRFPDCLLKEPAARS
jgi:hypothetical protein